MKELDQLLLAWVERHGLTTTPEMLAHFNALLDSNDSDLWTWVCHRAKPNTPEWEQLIEQIRTTARL
jgi:succinate dehydrogenase flavin-adding protein (antitoxin of CptAB toxin-antitoxin module)